MKKAIFTLMCLAAMLAAGKGLRAQEITITLNPGWTWISIPCTDTLTISEALGSFTPLDGDQIKSQWSSSKYRDGQWRGGVSKFYPGYGYKYYSTREMPVTLTFNSQQTSSQVVVTTSEPMLITGNSAMGGGEVTVSDGTYILVRGLCWATHENPTTNEDSSVEEGSGVGSFSATMTGLNWSTTYYYRAYAVTPSGTVYGEQQSFTTRDGIPTLTTNDITNITAISATSGGNITDNGGLNVTARGVCWSISPYPTVNDSHTTNGTGTGSFTSSITGLEINTTYYVRAYATTSAGTGYGEQVSFTTRNGIPTVTTVEVTGIGSAWAYSGGNITDDGGLAITARGVCWSTSPNPTLSDAHSSGGSGAGIFTSYITGLTMSTTYYVRAYATNSFVTVYGNQLSFTTHTLDEYTVDLGLPSGLLWATCNEGANAPEEYGDYFWPSDAAPAKWGNGWHMPTKEEWQELYSNTTVTWTQQNGVSGRLFTASNGGSIFLPAAGYRQDGSLYDAGSGGYYWSSSHESSSWRFMWYFDFHSDNYGMGVISINNELSVRVVCSASQD